MSDFTRHFSSAEKRVKLILLLNCESRVDLQRPENTVKFMFSKKAQEAGCEEVYTDLFESSSVQQVFEVGASSVSQKALSECVLGKTPKGWFSWCLEFGCGP